MNPCPLCGGSLVYEGLCTVECNGEGCKNNPSKKFDWRTEILGQIRHELQVERLKRYVKEFNQTNSYPRLNEVKKILDLPIPIERCTRDSSGTVDDQTMKEFLEHLHKHKK